MRVFLPANLTARSTARFPAQPGTIWSLTPWPTRSEMDRDVRHALTPGELLSPVADSGAALSRYLQFCSTLLRGITRDSSAMGNSASARP